jgi:hypothetical protein
LSGLAICSDLIENSPFEALETFTGMTRSYANPLIYPTTLAILTSDNPHASLQVVCDGPGGTGAGAEPPNSPRSIAGPRRKEAGVGPEKTPRPAGPDEKRETVRAPAKGPRLSFSAGR